MKFSLAWFKSKKKEEVKEVEESTTLTLGISTDPLRCNASITTTAYKSVKMVNDVITVVLLDGTVIIKPSAVEIDFVKISETTTIDEILKLVTLPEVLADRFRIKAEEEKIEITRKGLSLLEGLNDFVIIDDALYIKGTERSIPKLVTDAFITAIRRISLLEGDLETNLLIDVEYTSLKKFWLKCCLNPSAQSAEDLYTFLSNHQFKIDRHGNFYAYRKVVSVASEKNELVDFISNSYTKIKAVWKKKPINFDVYSRLGEYKFVPIDKVPTAENPFWEKVGNLDSLYQDLPTMTENRYTDNHTHSFDYRVGQSVSMPRHMGDDNNQISCSKGFHAASRKYDYNGFGDTAILMIINPMDVLAVPMGNVGKLRICRWFFAMTLSEDEKYILEDNSFDVTDLGDIFEEECMDDIQEYVKTSFAQEVQKHTFAIPQISAVELSNVVRSLTNMKELISKRVNVI